MSQSSQGVGAPSFRAEQRGALLIVTLDRQARRNALDDSAILEIEAIFSSIPDSVRCAVLHGEGANFSAGLDLSELTERDVVQGIAHSMMWHRAFETIQFGKVPVVAVMRGAVIGGGLELACATHVRVAEKSAYYALPEGQRGIYVGGGASVRLPPLIGVSRMMEMMLTGRVYNADEGQSLGLSHYVVDDGAGLARGIELAEKIAGNAPMTNFALVHALPRIAGADPATGFLAEALMAAAAQGSDEAKKRLRDFLEKRAPKVVAS